jgi:hypothetical protein
MAIGRNTIDNWFSSVTVYNNDGTTTTDNALTAYNNVTGDTNFLTDEAQLQIGDSGAPMMVENAGSLTLVGINWFITNDINGDPLLSGFSYVGNYASAINDFITANPFPELSATGIYMALFLMTLGLSSRRISLRSNGLQP